MNKQQLLDADRSGVRMRFKSILITSALAIALGACGSSEEVATTTTEPPAVASTGSDQNTTDGTNTATTESQVATTNAVPSVQVTVERGLVYREAVADDSGSERSLVDVYVPEAADGLPAVVLLHGYTAFDANSELVPLTALADEIAQLGAVVFYFKWYTVTGFSAASGDDLACIGSFVTNRAAEHGARSDQVVVVGHSMGAAAAASLAFRSFDLPTKGDCTEDSDQPTVNAVLSVAGDYDTLGVPVGENHDSFLVRSNCNAEPHELAASEFYKPGLTAQQAFDLGSYSSMDLIPPDLRVVLLVGTEDSNQCTIPPITRDFADALQTSGVEHELIEMAGAGHIDIVQPNADPGRNTLKLIETILADLEES